MKRFFSSDRRGQTLVEFALIIPAFILLTVVIFDFGRAVYYSSAVHNAAREGARAGIVNPDNFSAMESASIEYAVGLGLNPTDVDAYPGPSEWVGTEENYTVKVIVTYCFTPVTPLVEMFIPDDPDCKGKFLKLVGEAIMRTEVKPTNP